MAVWPTTVILIGKAHQFAPVPAQAKTRCAGRWRPPGRPVHPSFATDRSSDLSRRPRAFAAPPSSTCAPRASHTVVEATPSTASERGPFDRTLVRHAERALRDLHEARDRAQRTREPFAAVSAPQHRHRSCRDTSRTPSRASPASTTTAPEPTRTARLRAREVVRWAPATIVCRRHIPPSVTSAASSGIIAVVPWCALDQRLGAPAIRRPRRTLRLGPLLELSSTRRGLRPSRSVGALTRSKRFLAVHS